MKEAKCTQDVGTKTTPSHAAGMSHLPGIKDARVQFYVKSDSDCSSIGFKSIHVQSILKNGIFTVRNINGNKLMLIASVAIGGFPGVEGQKFS